MAKDKRFEVIHQESSLSAGSSTILVDRVTGVHYLVVSSGFGGGITPLLDSEGKPIVNKNAH